MEEEGIRKAWTRNAMTTIAAATGTAISRESHFVARRTFPSRGSALDGALYAAAFPSAFGSACFRLSVIIPPGLESGKSPVLGGVAPKR